MVTTYQDILTLGFKPEMFRFNESFSFQRYVEEIITLKSAVLQGKLGILYSTAVSPQAELVRRVEVCCVAAELCQRRINLKLSNVDATSETSPEYKQQKAYEKEADELMDVLTNYGYAGGVVVSSHFTVVSEVPDNA